MTTVATDRTLRGILFMVGFAVFAPIMDSFAKATPAYIPIAEIVAVRFLFQVAILVPFAMWCGIMTRPTARAAGLHVLRAAALLLATWLFFSALREMPLASAIAIFFVEPFILTLMGAVLLGESVGIRRILACLVGFGGALLVIQPSFSDLGLVALFPLGTAFCFACYMVLTRTLSQQVHPVTIQAHTAIAASVIIVPILVLFDGSGHAALDPAMPHGLAIWMMAGVGVMATLSHMLITYALRYAPAATIAPLQYLEIVSAAALGYVVFGDFPNLLTGVGILIIVGSGLYVFAREHRLQQRISSRPTPAP